jgi:nucleotide-binding universal stress UspA family protein
MYKHILIPTDGSDLSRAAALDGVRLAQALGARVTAFFAAPAATPMVYKGFLPVGYTTQAHHADMIERTATKYLGVIKQACAKANVPCESIHVTEEFPADAIMKIAKKRKCDLIFMASHGRRGISGVLLGSETQKVLTHSKTPVLVYR